MLLGTKQSIRAMKKNGGASLIKISSTEGIVAGPNLAAHNFGKPDDLDGAVLLLASGTCRYVTGVALPVDGGRTPPRWM